MNSRRARSPARSQVALRRRERAQCPFLGPATRQIASRRTSFFMVFFPSMRCSSCTRFSCARYSLAGSTPPPARVAVRTSPVGASQTVGLVLPRACERQVTRCCRAGISLRPCASLLNKCEVLSGHPEGRFIEFFCLKSLHVLCPA